LATAIALEDQDIRIPVVCNAVAKRLVGTGNQKTALIESLAAGQTRRDESVIVPQRLLLDEIVEVLPGNCTRRTNLVVVTASTLASMFWLESRPQEIAPL
jgi:hypothetical protein